jgi:hypothetical protein
MAPTRQAQVARVVEEEEVAASTAGSMEICLELPSISLVKAALLMVTSQRLRAPMCQRRP